MALITTHICISSLAKFSSGHSKYYSSKGGSQTKCYKEGYGLHRDKMGSLVK